MQKMRVWWIPQMPMKSFNVEVHSVEEGVKIMQVLSDYDAFQFKNKIKPDYCNTGGIQVWELDAGNGKPGWCDWYDEETSEDDPVAWLANKKEASNDHPARQ